MKKFFDLIINDLKGLYAKNKVAAILVISLLVLVLLSLIPAVASIVTFALTVVAVGFVALGDISAIYLLILYLKKVGQRLKDK